MGSVLRVRFRCRDHGRTEPVALNAASNPLAALLRLIDAHAERFSSPFIAMDPTLSSAGSLQSIPVKRETSFPILMTMGRPKWQRM